MEDLAYMSPPESLLLSCISFLVSLLSLPYTGTCHCQALLCSCLLSLPALPPGQPGREH